MLCPSCGSDELRSVAGDSDVPQTEPRQRDVDKSVVLVGTMFIIGVLWHIFWIGSALFFFLAIRDLVWNTFTWPRRYAAWARLHECANCGYIGPPEGLATAPVTDQALPRQ